MCAPYVVRRPTELRAGAIRRNMLSLWLCWWYYLHTRIVPTANMRACVHVSIFSVALPAADSPPSNQRRRVLSRLFSRLFTHHGAAVAWPMEMEMDGKIISQSLGGLHRPQSSVVAITARRRVWCAALKKQIKKPLASLGNRQPIMYVCVCVCLCGVKPGWWWS